MIALSDRVTEHENLGCEAIPPALDWTKVVRLLVDEGDDLQVMRVHGDSLRDAFVNDGDLVVLKPTVTARNGDMVAARDSSTKAMALEYYHRENGHVRLQSPDPALPARQLKTNEVEIQGQVIVIVRQVTHGRRLP
jgi:repressor LexA